MSEIEWGRAHAAAHDFATREDAEVVAARYREASRWAGYAIEVREINPERFYIAAGKRHA